MGAYFSLNTASWSLMGEYIASLAFALLLWRAKRSVLAVIVAVAAIGVAFSAQRFDHLWGGFAWGQMPDAFARTAFSFCMGVLLFRSGAAIRSPIGLVGLSAVLVILFIEPKAPIGCPNWLYEWIVAVAVFPLMIALGAGATTSPPMAKACDLFGRVS
jgi:peptidoglycan/LPS O-acetylase OafA/YrhL